MVDKPKEAPAAALLDALSANVLESGEANLVELWAQLGASRPETKIMGKLLATAGMFLWRPVRVSCGAEGPPLMDASAVRGLKLPPAACFPAVQETREEDQSDASRQREVQRALSSATAWVSEEARIVAGQCICTWTDVLVQKPGKQSLAAPHDLGHKDWMAAASLALFDFLPAATASLNDVAIGFKAAAAGLREENSERRALAVVLSLHWLMEHADYRALRDRLGICLPLLLRSLDHCGDSTVRLVGLDTLHLMLDRAMAVEVQGFVPPLLDCLSAQSPVFLEGDSLAISLVVPYCASYMLLLSKGRVGRSSWCQEAVSKFLAFGSVHCRASTAAFRCFLEYGLFPLLLRDVMLLAPRLQDLMELLLQASESTDAVEVLYAWRALQVLLGGELLPCVRHFALDVFLRLVFSYFTHLASGPPPGLQPSSATEAQADFVSPVVAAMTSAEWSSVEKCRPALREALRASIRLLATGSQGKLDELLAELQGLSGQSRLGLLEFTAFARDAVEVVHAS